MTTPTKVVDPRTPPYKRVAVVMLILSVVIAALVYGQFRGDFTPKTHLTMVSARAGLVMDPGSKVTYNGVEIGRVARISEIRRDGKPAAKLILDVDPRYIALIPANVDANIKATTVFGNKYVSLTSPKNPTPQRITPHDVIDAQVGDDRVQYVVRDDHVDRREGGSGQAEPDAERGRRRR